MTAGVHPDIVSSLAAVRGNVEQRLADVSRYRAMRSLEKTMADIADFQELVSPLRDVRERIERQLQETREYRALCALDAMVPQLKAVLAFLGETSDGKSPSQDEEKRDDAAATANSAAETLIDAYAHEQAEPAADVAEASVLEFIDIVSDGLNAHDSFETSDDSSITLFSGPEPAASETTEQLAMTSVAAGADAGQQLAPSEQGAPTSEASSEPTASPPVATLAYNLANMLVQSLPPGEAKAAPSDHSQSVPPPASPNAMQEGQAA